MTAITNFDDYLLFEDGSIFSLLSNSYIKQHRHEAGYGYYLLYKGGKIHYKTTHRLLGNQFIPNPDNKPLIDHKDRNTWNNELTNLHWATHSENQQNRKLMKNNYTTGISNIHKIIKTKVSRPFIFTKAIRKTLYRKAFATLEEAISYKRLFFFEKNLTIIQ